MNNMLWPTYDAPSDLTAIEAVALSSRGLPESTYSLLSRAASLWPDRVAVSVLPDAARWEQPSERTFRELLADVHQVANLLHGLGVDRGDAVSLLSPNCGELITATLAAQLAGVAAPINPGLSPDHITQLLNKSGARVLIAAGPELDPGVWQTAREIASQGEVDALLVLRPTAGDGPAEPLPAIGDVRLEYLSTLAQDEPDFSFAGVEPTSGDLAAVFHTGGTTGTPKLAAHTHANEVSDAWMIAANGLLDDDSTVFAALPLFHVNALVVTVLAPLFKGQRVVWAGPQGYRDANLYGCFWRLVERYQIAAMSSVPTVYALLAGCPVDADITSLRFALVGASPLPPAVRESFETHTGVALVEGYGLTEATCASARSFPYAPRPGAVGQRLPYQQVKTVEISPRGEWVDLPDGTVGILAIKGPTVFPGYVTGRSGEGRLLLDGRGKLRDGWLDTGDLARIDAEGFVHLAGRAKDLIIRGGHNIDPAIIEDALLSHPEVTAAQAVGRPDVHAGEVPVAFVTLMPGATATTAELRDWARDNVAEQAAAPKSVTVLEAMPVTDVGKPYKPALRADATRDAVVAALAGVDGVAEVRGLVEDGGVVAEIETTTGLDEAHVKDALGRYPIAWRLVAATLPLSQTHDRP
ncbi:acyl-CoA synthetase [Nocardioides sp. NPDC087217]|uniref:acyl-CoA synthetase n=1 Tax=Nocardioides sp. NPDC087217 TaxID=3364335 RepID=UPI0037FAFCC6